MCIKLGKHYKNLFDIYKLTYVYKRKKPVASLQGLRQWLMVRVNCYLP